MVGAGGHPPPDCFLFGILWVGHDKCWDKLTLVCTIEFKDAFFEVRYMHKHICFLSSMIYFFSESILYNQVMGKPGNRRRSKRVERRRNLQGTL